MKVDYRAHELLIQTFAQANPVFFCNVLREIGKDDESYHQSLADQVLGFTSQLPFLGVLRDNDSSPTDMALQEIYPGRMLPWTTVYHVFPTWNQNFCTGLMVPLSISRAEDWQISDAFGSFKTCLGKQSRYPFMDLLKLLEEKWKAVYSDSSLPLRWRQSFSLKLLCPVHLDAIEGKSLHVPLVLAVLRALSTTLDSIDKAATLPFGNYPVFATGKLCSDQQTFDKVEHVEEKARGFLREYGHGLPAILQKKQKRQLESAGLLPCFSNVYIADSIEELLQIEELRKALVRLTEPPHATEIDSLLLNMTRSSRSIRFDDVAAMARWLLPSIQSPFYQFKFHRHAGLVYAHRGRFIEAHKEVEACSRLLAQHKEMFGIADRCDLVTSAGVLAVDVADPDILGSLFHELEPLMHDLPVGKRVAFLGTKCQLLRVAGRLDEAILAGREAVRLADLGRASDAGRDRNYLVHALLARVKTSTDATQQQQDLQTAEQLIQASEEEWAPRDDINNRQAHLTFCLHYRAELARLQNLPFSLPEDNPPWQGHWGHGWSFALLSCARNRAHSLDERRVFAAKLVSSLGSPKNRDSLFFMLLQVYCIYAASLMEKSFDIPLMELQTWYEQINKKGFPGWKNRLELILSNLEGKNSETVESLCDAIPYH